ncbi:MAG: dTDP-4-dehydrorhamnose 3,5-epimerase, partial [Planctomycetaceae bacterium]|nr:dTDP-4-dehydrorhamnose 3,5-epimerase [Planctomycetaceae bacterium]
WFYERFNAERFRTHGLDLTFVQDNVSYSSKGILRGLHFQQPWPQGKLVSVLRGEVFDVAVDIRRGSPWFGQWTGIELSAENNKHLWIPPGFAHGFLVTGNDALFCYKCTEYYHPESEHSLAWNDSTIGISWPTAEVVLSAKDRAAKTLAEVSVDSLPEYQTD